MPNSRPSIPRTISLDDVTDRILVNASGGPGRMSEAVRAAIHLAYGDLENVPPSPSLDRARAYMKAKEAGMFFERDVGRVLKKAGVPSVESGVVWNKGGGVFVADYWIPGMGSGGVALICKSCVSEDRLMLALGEALIGRGKVPGAEVWVIVPYRVPGMDDAVKAYDSVPGVTLMTVPELIDRVGQTT